MLFYTTTILLCMIIIGTVDFFVAVPVFGFDLTYIVFAVIISTIGAIVIDLIFAFIVRQLLPQKWFSVDKTVYSAGKGERRFYEKIGIKKWKDKVLELGALSGFRKNKIAEPTNNDYVGRYILEANYGVIVHLVCIVVGFGVVFIYPIKYALCFGIPVAIVNAVLNLLPLFVLRYNLPKLHALYKHNEKKRLTGKKE